jgi:hypothetical protein
MLVPMHAKYPTYLISFRYIINITNYVDSYYLILLRVMM